MSTTLGCCQDQMNSRNKYLAQSRHFYYLSSGGLGRPLSGVKIQVRPLNL